MLKKIGIVLVIIGLGLIGFELYRRFSNEQKQSNIVTMFEKEGKDVDVEVTLKEKDADGKTVVITTSTDSILEIPDAKIKIPVLKQGNIDEVLEVAAGVLTSQPVGTGNYAIAGHHTMYKDNHFSNVLNLKGGEYAYVYTHSEKYTFKLSEPFKVNADEVWVLNDNGKSQLTIVTCEFPYDNGVRVIVQGDLVSVEPITP